MSTVRKVYLYYSYSFMIYILHDLHGFFCNEQPKQIIECHSGNNQML